MKRRLFVMGVGVGVVFAIIVVFSVRMLKQPSQPLITQERIDNLIFELTTTPSRQKNALNEIVRSENQAVFHLFSYMNDPRYLATDNVGFIHSVGANASDTYYLVVADTVGETVTKYLCWRTAVCRPSEVELDPDSQIRKLAELCRTRYEKPPVRLCPATVFRHRK